MIKPSELKALETDTRIFLEDLFLFVKRNPEGLSDLLFNHKITARVRELYEVCHNIERASFNRDISSIGKQ